MWITILHIQVLKSWVLKKQFYMTHTHTHTKQPKQERTNSKKIHCPFSVSTSYLCFSNPGDSRSRRLRTSMEVKDAVAVPSSRKKPHVIFGQFDTKHQKKNLPWSPLIMFDFNSSRVNFNKGPWTILSLDIMWYSLIWYKLVSFKSVTFLELRPHKHHRSRPPPMKKSNTP